MVSVLGYLGLWFRVQVLGFLAGCRNYIVVMEAGAECTGGCFELPASLL